MNLTQDNLGSIANIYSNPSILDKKLMAQRKSIRN